MAPLIKTERVWFGVAHDGFDLSDGEADAILLEANVLPNLARHLPDSRVFLTG